MINYKLKIDFLDSKILASDICFVSGDVKSSALYFEFYNDGKRVDISGYTLSVRARRSDGVVIASSGKIQNNTAVFIPENNFYAVPGELYMEIALSDSSGKYITTKIITAEVLEGLGENAVDGVDNLNVYVKLVSDAILAKESAEAAAQIAKSVHPKIVDDVWWVYDSAKGALVSSGINAQGPQGIQGEQGVQGYTPQRGVDYWTEEDMADIHKYIDGEATKLQDETKQAISDIKDQCSNALKGSASGEVISIADISPVEHNLGVKVSSKNLFDKDYALDPNNWKYMDNSYDAIPIYVGKGNTVTVSYKNELNAELGFYSAVSTEFTTADNVSSWLYVNTTTAQKNRLITLTATEDYIYLRLAPKPATYSTTLPKFMEYIGNDLQIEIGATATKYTPYIKADDITINKFGKNLVPYPFFEGFFNSETKTQTKNGITATDLGDGGVRLNGTATAETYINLHNTPIGYRYISGNYGKNGVFFANKYNDNIYISHDGNNHATYILIAGGTVCDNIVYYPQIEVGSEFTGYEKGIPYEVFTANADGTVNGVKSVYPNATLITNMNGALIDCEYNKDINKAFAELQNAIISLGGNV